MEFTWITDCFGICFVLSYDGNNEVVHCPQMQLRLWKMTSIHCYNEWIWSYPNPLISQHFNLVCLPAHLNGKSPQFMKNWMLLAAPIANFWTQLNHMLLQLPKSKHSSAVLLKVTGPIMSSEPRHMLMIRLLQCYWEWFQTQCWLTIKQTCL